MYQTITDDLTVYIALAISVIIFIQAYSKIPHSALYVKPAARFLLYILVFTAITSGVFYRQIRQISPQTTSFNAWIAGLDITLAHTIITTPIFFEGFYLATKIASVLPYIFGLISIILANLSDPLFKKHEDVRDRIHSVLFAPSSLLLVTQPILGLIGAVWFVWFLFVGTIDLQQILFGNYDGSLGWTFPTSFRFTVLYNQVKSFAGINPVFTTIIGFIAFAISMVLGIASLFKAVKDIGETLKKDSRLVPYSGTTKRAPDAGDSAAFQAFSTPPPNPAPKQNPRPPQRR